MYLCVCSTACVFAFAPGFLIGGYGMRVTSRQRIGGSGNNLAGESIFFF